MNKLQFSPYVCPKCQSIAMNFEIENGVEICGLCETPLIQYSAIPSAELAALREQLAKAEAEVGFFRKCFPREAGHYERISTKLDAAQKVFEAALKGDS